MALNINVTNDCKFLVVRGKSYINGSSGEIQVTHYETGSTMSPNAVINFNGVNGSGVVNITTETLPNPNGLYQICLIENNTEQICLPVLIHCDLDCCLTKLTNELLACACDCPRCAITLAKAQKIFLLLQSANSNVAIATADPYNEGYYIDILRKYKKAVELCDSSCGCDC